MKRIAIISLVVVFLTASYAYATFPIEELAQTIEQAQHEELTQEEAEELFVALIVSVDWNDLEQIEPNMTACQYAVLVMLIGLVTTPAVTFIAMVMYLLYC